jgi:hypothetical protein
MATRKAEKTARTFHMLCAVRATIRASADTLWSILTDAASFPKWNSTLTSIEGQIAEGQSLKVKVPSSPERAFKPKVSLVEAGRTIIWSDGMAPMFKGVRTFTLTPDSDGTTEFAMVERFSGIMLPMIEGSLPDFAPTFETYAADLTRAAERAA